MLDSDTEYNAPRTREDFNLKSFIEKLETYPSLWDKYHINYNNDDEREKALNSLLPTYQKIKPNGTTDDVIEKINDLRSNYRKVLKKMSPKSSNNNLLEPCYIPRSWVFYMLYFLKENTQTESVGSDNNTMEIEQTKDDTEHSYAKDTKVRSRTNSSCSTQLAITPTPAKNMKQEVAAMQTELTEKTCPVVLQSSLHPNINPTALYWSGKLERLDLKQRIFAEKAINDVLFEAELGNLQKGSVYFKRKYSPKKNRKHK